MTSERHRCLVFILVLAGHVAATRSYARVWVDSIALWSHAARVAPYKPRIRYNLGRALTLAGQPAEGSAQFGMAWILAKDFPSVPEWDRADIRNTVVVLKEEPAP